MRYISTRGQAPTLNFEEVMMTGLAADGGLYLPQTWPHFTKDEIRHMRGASYQHTAYQIISRFTGDTIPPSELRAMIDDAYAEFDHPAIAPLKQLSPSLWLLELFHGPTLAFKDVAMQLLARMMDWSLQKNRRTATIIGATSGDTGGAAVEAFKNNDRARTFILHPHGRVSDVQRRQMTTVDRPNIFNIALEGTFDDCQAIVKDLFNDPNFRQQTSLSGVNSINWARIMAQIVYYFTSAVALGAPDRQVSFTVPTGNFGDIFAGYAAKQMGLPIAQLVIATNVNDILDRTLKTGTYEVKGVTASLSPSMDIQISSNFERLLYLLYGRDAAAIRQLMENLKQSGSFTLSADALKAIRAEFHSVAVNEEETTVTIAETLKNTGELLDPHSAVAVAAAQKQTGSTAMIALSTAHPAKFPEAVAKSCGVTPHLPPRLSYLLKSPERFIILPNQTEAVRDFILSHNKV